MTAPDPNCPHCKGRGWYEGPGSDVNFGPGTEFYPCYACTTLEPMPRWAKLLLGIVLGLLFALFIGGFR